MYICICNAFTDKDVKEHLSHKKSSKASVGKTYKACSGGESPNCCKCIKDLRKMVAEHNHHLTVRALKCDMNQESLSPSRETVSEGACGKACEKICDEPCQKHHKKAAPDVTEKVTETV